MCWLFFQSVNFPPEKKADCSFKVTPFLEKMKDMMIVQSRRSSDATVGDQNTDTTGRNMQTKHELGLN